MAIRQVINKSEVREKCANSILVRIHKNPNCTVLIRRRTANFLGSLAATSLATPGSTPPRTATILVLSPTLLGNLGLQR